MSDDALLYPAAAGEAPPERLAGRLVVVRHGTTSWSRAGRHTGRTDVPLEAAGRREAGRIGERIRGHRFVRVLTSPSSRAAETCALAGFEANAEVCEDLREWDYGAYEGRTTAEIRAEHPGWTLWRDGVRDGETLADLARRADRVVALARSAPGDTLAFAHGHILRVVCARWLGLVAQEAARFVLEPAALGVLGWEREQAALVRWNDGPGPPLG